MQLYTSLASMPEGLGVMVVVQKFDLALEAMVK